MKQKYPIGFQTFVSLLCMSAAIALMICTVANTREVESQLNIPAAPTNTESYLKRGEYLAGIHEFDRAIEKYNLALQGNGHCAEAYNDRGHAYYWKHDYVRAITDFTKAIELRPNYPNAYNNRGAAYMASGWSSEKAIADFNRAIQLKPDFRNAYVNRANSTLWRNPLRALDDFRRAGMHPERLLTVLASAFAIAVVSGVALARKRKKRKDDQGVPSS